jgi:TRAP-type C4-dicarboxylate transport system substrate-binding protein
VSVPYADLYTALQTGVAEGWYGGAAVHSYLGFRDVIKYYYPMNIYAESEQWIINQRVWDALPDDQKELLQSTIADINKNSIKIAEEEELSYQKRLEEAGVKVFHYSADDLKATVDYVRKTVWPKLDNILGKELTEALIKEYSAK